MIRCIRLLLFAVCLLSVQALFSTTFNGEVNGALTTLAANKDAPSYIRDIYPFIGDFSLKGGLFIPFSYAFSGEVSGGFLFDDKKLELDNFYLEYYGDRFSLIGGKSELQWGYGWFSHPSFFPDYPKGDQDRQMLFENPYLWNISFTYFFEISNFNVILISENLESDDENIYSAVIRHDLFFQHLALGWDLSLSVENSSPEFHGAVDGEVIFNENWKIDFALDYQYPDLLTYVAGFNLNLGNYMFIGEISGLNDLVSFDLLSQLTLGDVFTPAMALHYGVSENAGTFTLLLEHELSKQMEHGFYLNYHFDFARM